MAIHEGKAGRKVCHILDLEIYAVGGEQPPVFGQRGDPKYVSGAVALHSVAKDARGILGIETDVSDTDAADGVLNFEIVVVDRESQAGNRCGAVHEPEGEGVGSLRLEVGVPTPDDFRWINVRGLENTDLVTG